MWILVATNHFYGLGVDKTVFWIGNCGDLIVIICDCYNGNYQMDYQWNAAAGYADSVPKPWS